MEKKKEGGPVDGYVDWVMDNGDTYQPIWMIQRRRSLAMGGVGSSSRVRNIITGNQCGGGRKSSTPSFSRGIKSLRKTKRGLEPLRVTAKGKKKRAGGGVKRLLKVRAQKKENEPANKSGLATERGGRGNCGRKERRGVVEKMIALVKSISI